MPNGRFSPTLQPLRWRGDDDEVEVAADLWRGAEKALDALAPRRSCCAARQPQVCLSGRPPRPLLASRPLSRRRTVRYLAVPLLSLAAAAYHGARVSSHSYFHCSRPSLASSSPSALTSNRDPALNMTEKPPPMDEKNGPLMSENERRSKASLRMPASSTAVYQIVKYNGSPLEALLAPRYSSALDMA